MSINILQIRPIMKNDQFSFTCVKALHSTYFTALSSLASFSPCSPDIGFCLFFASFSVVATSSLKSIWVPTSKNGVLWQWCVISGTHYKTTCYYKRISIDAQEHNGQIHYLFFYIFEWWRWHNREAHEKHVSLRIT